MELVAILIYNFFAFAMQLPIGILADKINMNAVCSAIGCILVAIAFEFANYGIISCLIAGIGNAMFYVGGGIDVLNISNKKATLSRIFVSTGAMGIFLGGKSASIGFDKYYIVILILLISAISLLWLYNQIKNSINNSKIKAIKLTKNEWIAIVCIFITVCIRSYVGIILTFFESIVKNNIIYKNHYEIHTIPEIIDRVAEDKYGIGYAFNSYYTRMYPNNKTKDIRVNEKSIKDSDYPLLFEVYLIYRTDNNNENISKIVNWLETDEGQEFVENIKF